MGLLGFEKVKTNTSSVFNAFMTSRYALRSNSKSLYLTPQYEVKQDLFA